jgi:hypothetical protein
LLTISCLPAFLVRLPFSNRVTRGIPSDLASLNSVQTSGGASVMGMFNTSALYNDPLLDTYSVAGSSVAAARGGSGKAQPMSGVKGTAPGAGRGSNFDTASLKSQDDNSRYKKRTQCPLNYA